MNQLEEFFKQADPDVVGEMLREITFVKNRSDEFGCYSTFEVIKSAREANFEERTDFWRRFRVSSEEDYAEDFANLGQGYTYLFMGFIINVCWYWDGDGCLVFEILNEDYGNMIRCVVNNDCKKNYRWKNVLRINS